MRFRANERKVPRAVPAHDKHAVDREPWSLVAVTAFLHDVNQVQQTPLSSQD